jgi:hypothetical protein
MAPSTAIPRPFEKRAADFGCTEMIRLDETSTMARELADTPPTLHT